jgi:hypothetical protein
MLLNFYKKFQLIFLLFTVIIATVGCSKQEISGQIFTKQNDKNTPLAGIEIKVVDYEKFKTHTEDFKKNRSSTLLKIANYQKNLEEMKLLTAELTSIGVQLISNAQLKEVDLTTLKSAITTVITAEAIVEVKKENLKKSYQSFKEGKHPSIYFLPKYNDESSFQTDSDGRFKISILKSQSELLITKGNGAWWFYKPSTWPENLILHQTSSNDFSCKDCIILKEDFKSIREAVAKSDVKNLQVADTKYVPSNNQNILELKDKVNIFSKKFEKIIKRIADLTVANAGLGALTGERYARERGRIKMGFIDVNYESNALVSEANTLIELFSSSVSIESSNIKKLVEEMDI